MKNYFFIYSRPQNRVIYGNVLAISLQENAGFNPRSFISIFAKTRILALGLAIIFLLSFGGTGFCSDSNELKVLFYKGNAAYSEEKFDEAINDYEKILSMGSNGGRLYYNLGNAYFKKGLLGKAILNYSRARRLIPRDADLKANLNYARSLIKGGVLIQRRNLFSRFFFGLAGFFSFNESVFLSAILYFILFILIIFVIMIKKFKRVFLGTTIVFTVLFIIFVSFSLVKFFRIVVEKEGVIVVDKADARFEPFEEATVFFTLNEGESFFVAVSKENWLKVRRIDGKEGWIKKEKTELL
ncbi:MAG: tetratricopeptide repeat protein [Candidatus Omnitrophota bacterium]